MKNNRALSITSFLTLVGCFFILFFLGLTSKNIQNFLSRWGEETKVSIFLNDQVNDEAKSEIESLISKSQIVKKYEFIPKDVAQKEFQNEMNKITPELVDEADFFNLIPSSFMVVLKRGAELEQVQLFAQQFKAKTSVEDVDYGQNWLEKFSGVFSFINKFILMFSVIVCLVIVLVVNNVIKTNVYTQREKIEILELVGASRLYILKPFFKQSLTLTGLALVFSILLNLVIFEQIRNVTSFIPELSQSSLSLEFYSRIELSIYSVIILLAVLLSSYMTVKKINTGMSLTERLLD